MRLETLARKRKTKVMRIRALRETPGSQQGLLALPRTHRLTFPAATGHASQWKESSPCSRLPRSALLESSMRGSVRQYPALQLPQRCSTALPPMLSYVCFFEEGVFRSAVDFMLEALRSYVEK